MRGRREHLFGGEAKVHVTNALAHLAQQAAVLQWGRAGFHGKFISGCLSSIGTRNPGCKTVSGGFDGQLIEHPPFYGAAFAPYMTFL
jgi:hypothetical protein